MYHSPVLWQEGMFLRPHHFQANERYWQELLAANIFLDHPCSYGIARMFVSAMALESNLLELVGLSVRMKDGTVLENEGTHVDSVDLGLRLLDAPPAQSIDVFLAIPRSVVDQANTSNSSVDSPRRYVALQRDVIDEVRGENQQSVSFRCLNYRIMFSTEDCDGFDLLPLLRLIPTEQGKVRYRIDPHYFPPMLQIAACQGMQGLLSDLYRFVFDRAQKLGEILRRRGAPLSSAIENNTQNVWLLHSLNQAAAELESIARSPSMHPLFAYSALCKILGHLSVFGPKMVYEGSAPYDHDHLSEIFHRVCDRIRDLMNNIEDIEVVQEFFEGCDHGLRVELQPQLLVDEAEWYFGVNPLDFDREKVCDFMDPKQGGLAWLLASPTVVESYFAAKRDGIRVSRLRDIPRPLAGRGNWVFFRIRTETDEWKQVVSDGNLAIRIKDKQIANPTDLQEESRTLQANIAGGTYAMEFAVFAVRKRT